MDKKTEQSLIEASRLLDAADQQETDADNKRWQAVSHIMLSAKSGASAKEIATYLNRPLGEVKEYLEIGKRWANKEHPSFNEAREIIRANIEDEEALRQRAAERGRRPAYQAEIERKAPFRIKEALTDPHLKQKVLSDPEVVKALRDSVHEIDKAFTRRAHDEDPDKDLGERNVVAEAESHIAYAATNLRKALSLLASIEKQPSEFERTNITSSLDTIDAVIGMIRSAVDGSTLHEEVQEFLTNANK